MRVILLLLLVGALAGWFGYWLRDKDKLASGILFVIAAAAIFGLLGGFFGWFATEG